VYAAYPRRQPSGMHEKMKRVRSFVAISPVPPNPAAAHAVQSKVRADFAQGIMAQRIRRPDRGIAVFSK